MIKNLLVVLIISIVGDSLSAQKLPFPNNPYENEFDFAYSQYPAIPKGILEAVSYSMTRFHHIENPIGSCMGLPKTYGVMGLTLDGQNYFRNNLNQVSQLSGISVNDILQSPQQNILAYASAYNQLLASANFDKSKIENHAQLLVQLSELPFSNLVQDYAINAQLFEIFTFLNQTATQKLYGFPTFKIDFNSLFGAENYEVLKSSKVLVQGEEISSNQKHVYTPSSLIQKSVDYTPAIWNAASTSNYTVGRSMSVSAVTIHDIEGSYASCISWFKNPTANVSAHYVIRSSDGQVTQMVLESDKAWHVGSENPYTIGFEHEGYANQTGWYTTAMLQSSADLVRDICNSGYGINPLRTAFFPWTATTIYANDFIPGSCVTIKGHQHYPNQTHTDPGQYWDWDYFYKYINNTTPITINNNASGTVTDLGGAGSYTNDERTLFLIQPNGASSITLNINLFDIEDTWDYLYIYDGTTPFANRIGIYTGTTIPSSITVNSGNALIEFRSDCSTIKPGYQISWTSTAPDTVKPITLITGVPNPTSTNFTAGFTDTDNAGGSGILHQFYQVIDYDGTEWRANQNNGFFSDNFDVAIHSDWTTSSGVWSISGGYLTQTDEANANSNIYAPTNQNTYNKYLYHWEGKMDGAGVSRRAGFHFMCDNAALTNRGNSYFVWFRLDDDEIQIYKVVNDTFSLQVSVPYTFNASVWYDFKTTFDKTNGEIDVFVNNVFKASWVDVTPLTTGNFVSFRNAEGIYTVNNLKVYHNRSNTALVTVGAGAAKDIRYQGTPAGKIKSIVIDNTKNISAITEELVNVNWTTGINPFNNLTVKLYPNPVKEILSLEFNESLNNTNVIVRDVLNREVIAQTIESGNKLSINVSALTQGVYFLEFNQNHSKKVFKFLKE